MEIVETTKIDNLPNDPKQVDAKISTIYGDFVGRNPTVVTKWIEIKICGGTSTITVIREMK